ncbi:hypothetical protein CIB48_g1734 [Xylaria polymorpha]|nr:hypothetical protein CIB48_g1734 [Xylaria polymorpha]
MPVVCKGVHVIVASSRVILPYPSHDATALLEATSGNLTKMQHQRALNIDHDAIHRMRVRVKPPTLAPAMSIAVNGHPVRKPHTGATNQDFAFNGFYDRARCHIFGGRTVADGKTPRLDRHLPTVEIKKGEFHVGRLSPPSQTAYWRHHQQR